MPLDNVDARNYVYGYFAMYETHDTALTARYAVNRSTLT